MSGERGGNARSRPGTLQAAWWLVLLSVAGCEQLGLKPKTPEELLAEGKALGAACRHVGRSLEDCYARHAEASKPGIYAGWKEMHEYMAAQSIPTMKPPDETAPAEAEPGQKEEKAAAGTTGKGREDDKPARNESKTDAKSDAKTDSRRESKPDGKSGTKADRN